MTDLQTVENGGDANHEADQLRTTGGRFASGNAGGPGRPAGTPNRTTADLRELRREIAAAYHTCGGREIMERLARERPEAFMACVIRCLPREDRLELAAKPSMKIVVTRDTPPDETLDLVNRCLRLADGKPVTREHIVHAMRAQAAKGRIADPVGSDDD